MVSSTSVLAMAAALALAALPIRGVGGVSVWQAPTPGCDSQNSQVSCCAPTTIPVLLGSSANMTLKALQAEGQNTIISLVPGLPGTGVQGGATEGLCCGFAQFLANTPNAAGNPASLSTLWATPSPASITEDQIPTSYCASFRATHGGTNANSACIKQVCYKLCVAPQFTFRSKFMPSPNFVDNSNNCGVGKGPGGADAACLLLAGAADAAGPITAYLQVSNTLVMDPTSNQVMGVRVGVPVTFTVNTISFDSTGTLDILVVEDPGSPIGLQAGTTSRSCAAGVSACRTVTYVPRKSHEGKMQTVKFVARNLPSGTACPPLYSGPLEVRIPVSLPAFDWTSPIGDRYKEVPVGAVYEETLVCTANNYPAKVGFLNMSVNGIPADASAGMGHGALQQVSTTPSTLGSEARSLFRARSPASDAGSSRQWCFTCGDTGDITPPKVVCVSVKTRLCEFAVETGDTLQTLARKHHLDTNWLRVWNANPSMSNPDLAITEDRLLTFTTPPDKKLEEFHSARVGGVYTIKRGDTLTTVAARFETSVKRLLSVNPLVAGAISGGYQNDGGLQPGMDICVLVCTSKLQSRAGLFGWNAV